MIVPAAIFSQSWLFLYNHFNKGAWPGTFSAIPFNPDGIQGAFANFIRYMFESFNCAAPMELFYGKIFKWSMAENLEMFFNFFYVCSGFSIAFFLPPWRFTKIKKMIFQAGGCLLLFLTLLAAS